MEPSTPWTKKSRLPRPKDRLWMATLMVTLCSLWGVRASIEHLNYFNISYIFNRAAPMIEFNVTTSEVHGLRIVHFTCVTKLKFKQPIEMSIYSWPTISNGLPSYMAGFERVPKKKKPIRWTMAKNIALNGDLHKICVDITEPFYRQFGQYRCKAKGINNDNIIVEFVSTPFSLSEQWFLSRFP
ncbi:uncharacterized protein LOC106050552 [Biomphalaria glabrata]|uniref:Uncharacterized protein LOC106050552 n=1 Tax=Biomphalaria glabrata TaxID=6526 RepID=A0A9W2ZJU1_BIOGL|nr:uncharacterized protein LOC106050552 [Biomphalaria glabrata]XP_055875257.1 uncharacterized protein LOC106050552 [Biomphalaria glabrata]